MAVRLGLVIGNSAYRDTNLTRLATPDVDVGDLADVLLDPEVGGFDDVKVLVNSSSTTIRRTISDFYFRKERDDLLLLYFSGHGVLDENGQLYLAIKDTERQFLRATAIPASFITEEMNNSRSQRQLLILDCCHSGAFARGSKGAPGASVGTASAFEGTGFGRVVLTATDATQYAWEGDQAIGEPINSVFTHHLIQGLQSGDADLNQDGRITIDELYDYVYAHVIHETPRQTPGKWSYKEQGEMIIAQAIKPVIKERASGRTPPSSEPGSQRNLELKYTQALSAFWLEDWERAKQLLNEVIEIRPDYEEAAAKLAEVNKQEKLQSLYQAYEQYARDGDWTEAVAALETLTGEAPDYKNAAADLQAARKKMQLQELYAEARQLSAAGKYPAVLRVFEHIHLQDADFPDVENLLANAQEAAQTQVQQKHLDETYRKALLELNAGNHEQARDLLLQVQQMQSDYLDTATLLARVGGILSERSKPAEQPAAEVSPVKLQPALAISPVSRLSQMFNPALGRMRESVTRLRSRPSPLGQILTQEITPIIQETSALRRLPDKDLWRMLAMAASWAIAEGLLIRVIPTGWIDMIKTISRDRLSWEGSYFLLAFVLSGIPASLILWWYLRQSSVEVSPRGALSLSAGWLSGTLLASIIFFIGRGDSISNGLWTLGNALIGAGLGLALWRTLRHASAGAPAWSAGQLIAGTTVSLAAGAFAGAIIYDLLVNRYGGIPGHVLDWMISFAFSGLMLAWVLAERRWKSLWLANWRSLLLGAAGFTAAHVIYSSIFPLDFWSMSFTAYLAFVGAVGTAILVAPCRNLKRILGYGLLGGIGLMLGHLAWIAFYDFNIEIPMVAFWGVVFGLAVGAATRSLPAALSLALLSAVALLIPAELFMHDWKDHGDALAALLFWLFSGGLLGLLITFLINPGLMASKPDPD